MIRVVIDLKQLYLVVCHCCIVSSYIHWMLSRNNGFSVVEKWWQHKPKDVLESNNCKIMWDFTIYTGLNLAHDRPDITVMYK